VSALLLDVRWLGLAGWKWLFILEGLPAVVLGLITLWLMTDRPRHAKWLTPQERDYLENTLAAEAQTKQAKMPLSQVIGVPSVWLMALGIFATNTGGYALGFWLPTTVKNLSGGSDRAALLYSGLFYSCGLIGVFLSGQSSDRHSERKWHCVAGQVATAIFLALSTLPGQSFGLVMMWLCLTGFTAYFWPSPFWALPTLTLSASAAAVAIGLINMCANLAGYLGNHTIGWLKGHGVGEGVCLLFLAANYFLGGVFVSFLKVAAPARTRTPGSTHS
jgi:ACS family tartrate transporter-like MFS transporter